MNWLSKAYKILGIEMTNIRRDSRNGALPGAESDEDRIEVNHDLDASTTAYDAARRTDHLSARVATLQNRKAETVSVRKYRDWLLEV